MRIDVAYTIDMMSAANNAGPNEKGNEMDGSRKYAAGLVINTAVGRLFVQTIGDVREVDPTTGQPIGEPLRGPLHVGGATYHTAIYRIGPNGNVDWADRVSSQGYGTADAARAGHVALC